jgi:hypothetical protein
MISGGPDSRLQLFFACPLRLQQYARHFRRTPPGDDFFSGHDDDPTICKQERAGQDARAVYKKYKRGAQGS